MTDASLPDLGAKPKGGFLRKAIRSLILAILLVGGGFGAGIYFSGGAAGPADQVLRLLEQDLFNEGEPRQRVPRALPETAQFETSYYAFADTLTTNLKGSRRFLQVGIGISTQYDAAVLTNVDKHLMALRSDMLAVISGFGEEDITGEDGRHRLATALMAAINARLEQLEGFGGVEDLFFSSFVLQ